MSAIGRYVTVNNNMLKYPHCKEKRGERNVSAMNLIRIAKHLRMAN
jgi:hypothetical protein